ncbi:glycoside hydrolase family 5 protein [Gonapodya prolifera JEL478]|uniref:glucan 1,3-beta-glucosidase n=1 Tax=Gonapodya prolifera (strain JEL478) TaxID=1344416 RepID=A0A139AR22_GONPJ|nr:glycoside hydrolase family 5 protein [Gonapodya prolifera JEL478]|eukprot:KXS18945.1 glycoside hydrolase family 5 protein [Gonapodya prolifera JEL478]
MQNRNLLPAIVALLAASSAGSVSAHSGISRRQTRSCDTIHAAYVAGATMTAQDFADWDTWKCSTWFPGGIGTRTCDTIHAAYAAGVAMTAQDYSDWAAWACNTWFPGGIGSPSPVTTTRTTTRATTTKAATSTTTAKTSTQTKTATSTVTSTVTQTTAKVTTTVVPVTSTQTTQTTQSTSTTPVPVTSSQTTQDTTSTSTQTAAPPPPTSSTSTQTTAPAPPTSSTTSQTTKPAATTSQTTQTRTTTAAALTTTTKKFTTTITTLRSCDTIHAAYAAGVAMTAQDFADWQTWSCNTWFPGGIGTYTTVAVRSCDTIHAVYAAGGALSAQDYSDWAAWSCNTWYPGGIGTAPPPPAFTTTLSSQTSTTTLTGPTTTTVTGSAGSCASLYSAFTSGRYITDSMFLQWAAQNCPAPTIYTCKGLQLAFGIVPGGYGTLTNTAIRNWWNSNNCANSLGGVGSNPFSSLGVIRGVNLGGWINIEPFITPSVFTYNGVVYTDNYQLCAAMGTSACSARLQQFYSTFITEDDFRQIAAAGLNYIRLPVNYWAVYADPSEPYPGNIGWPFIQSAMEWAGKYGLALELDLHATPGSQNPWNHCGREGFFGWQTNFDSYKARTTATLLELVRRSAAYPSVKALQLVNEPTFYLMATSDSQVRTWYRDVERAIRNLTADATLFPNGAPNFIIHDGFRGANIYDGTSLQYQALGNTALDVHNYACFSQADLSLSYDGHVSEVCNSWGPTLANINRVVGPTMIGEFSAAYSDCAPYLNGVNEKARYDGSYLAEATPNICGCSCTDPNIYDYRNWNTAKKAFIRKFVEAQMSAFEQNGIGWIFWTWKTETKLGEWDYQLGLAQGWIPNPATNRAFSC